MSDSQMFESVDADLRSVARGKWAELIQAVESDDATIFVKQPTADQAKGSLIQAMRSRGRRLHTKSTTHNGVQGKVFWSEAK